MPPFTSPAVTARLSPLLVSKHAQRILANQHQQLTLNRHVVFSRSSSMAAIVRGLRRSFRDPDGRRPAGYNPVVAEHVKKRRLEREAAGDRTYKILRGKKDVTDRAVPKAKTRRARFFDPEDEYGKKSIVYQAKTGKLEEEVKALQRERGQYNEEEELGGRERSFRRDGGGRNGRNVSDTRDGGFESRSRGGRRTDGLSSGGRIGPRSRQGRDRENDRDGFQERDGDRGERQSYNRDRAPARQSDARSEGRLGREQRQDYDKERSYGRRDDRRDDKSSFSAPVPSTVPFTTAASQFIYGRTSVMAALRASRRKLYKLYVYRSTDSPAEKDTGKSEDNIVRCARQVAGLKVVHVDERWQRILSKMSTNRPHNGFVLEASTLPQPPIVGLGHFTGAGFPATMGYQSREEEAINGTGPEVFVPVRAATAQHHRPLVLLLDQVVDPGNLGNILRSASFLGVSAVAISKHSAKVSAVVLKASVGAAESLPIFSVEDPTAFLAESRNALWKVYTAMPPPEGFVPGRTRSQFGKPVYDLRGLEVADPLRKDPVILVVGSEGFGLPRTIRRMADAEVSIVNRSGSDVVDSLNVSVAASLLCASFFNGSTTAAANAPAVEATPFEATPVETTQSEAEAEAESAEVAAVEEAPAQEETKETKSRDEMGLFA